MLLFSTISNVTKLPLSIRAVAALVLVLLVLLRSSMLLLLLLFNSTSGAAAAAVTNISVSIRKLVCRSLVLHVAVRQTLFTCAAACCSTNDSTLCADTLNLTLQAVILLLLTFRTVAWRGDISVQKGHGSLACMSYSTAYAPGPC
jgi:hypothetical protein